MFAEMGKSSEHYDDESRSGDELQPISQGMLGEVDEASEKQESKKSEEKSVNYFLDSLSNLKKTLNNLLDSSKSEKK